MRVKVIEFRAFRFRSINRKYNKNFSLSAEYRMMKRELTLISKKYKVPHPYYVEIYAEMYLDIDNPLKCILDSLIKTIENDREIYRLLIVKKPNKRGKEGRLRVYVNIYKDRKKEMEEFNF